jgi:histidyl-tRNA synthetase
LIKAEKKSVSDVLIIPMVEDLSMPIRLATNLRDNGVKTEIYLNHKKLKAKFKYADKLEIPYVIIIGEDEINQNKFKLKDMKTGEEKEIAFDDIDSLEF